MEESDRDDQWIESRDFDQVLYEIRNSPRQNEMIRKETFAFWKICLAICTSCFAVFLAYMAWQEELSIWYSIASIVFALLCLHLGNSLFVENNISAKNQDRIYFLKCIRASRSVDELNLSAFFAYLPNRVGDGFEEDRDNEVDRMIKALSCRSEAMMWVIPRPDRPFSMAEEQHYKAERANLSGREDHE